VCVDVCVDVGVGLALCGCRGCRLRLLAAYCFMYVLLHGDLGFNLMMGHNRNPDPDPYPNPRGRAGESDCAPII
jgi:hypothetical protein